MHKVNSYRDINDSLRSSGNFRSIPADRSDTGSTVDLSSNDYLGLAEMPGLQEQFFADPQNRSIPMTSSASRLLAARQNEYARLESLLESLYKRPTLLFNSGYHANTGLISSLAAGAKTLIVADKLVHASIIDGIVLSKAPFTRFRHNDLAHLERILAKEESGYERIIIAVESVYSMDGDRADIEALAAIRRRYPKSLLFVDEAHAFGAEGTQGLGLSRDSACYDDVDVIVGTFGKACASMGAFAAVPGEIKEYLVNRARSFIFSTALPPLSAAWTEHIIRQFLPMDDRRSHLRLLGERLNSWLQPLSPDYSITPSHIQPLILGDPERAVEVSRLLRDEGFIVLPIRTPTVPPGTERLRISLNANLTFDQIDRFGETLNRILR